MSATATAGTYTATCTGGLAGSTRTLNVSVGGVTLSGQPTITVNASTVNDATAIASFDTRTVAVGGDDLLTIQVKDAAGNPITGLTSSAFGFALSGGTSNGAFSTVSATATAGTYTATFTAAQSGSASTLFVTVAGVTPASRPTITVTPGRRERDGVNGQLSMPTVASGGRSVDDCREGCSRQRDHGTDNAASASRFRAARAPVRLVGERDGHRRHVHRHPYWRARGHCVHVDGDGRRRDAVQPADDHRDGGVGRRFEFHG